MEKIVYLPIYYTGMIDEILSIYKRIRPDIERRLEEFRRLWSEGSDEDIYAELVFCLLTPQSKATVCWKAVEEMRRRGILLQGSYEELLETLQGVRFKYTKARNIVMSRTLFIHNGRIKLREILSSFSTPWDMREFLVKNVRGMGYKEASHFLRNIGFGADLAILDRHILKNLRRLGVIEEMPKTLSRRKYLEIEERMRRFCREIGIPMEHLDLVLWYRETGMIFK